MKMMIIGQYRQNWGEQGATASRPRPGHLFPSSAVPSCVKLPHDGLGWSGQALPISITSGRNDPEIQNSGPLTFGGLCLGFLVISLVSLVGPTLNP